jgi:hypothetical protein
MWPDVIVLAHYRSLGEVRCLHLQGRRVFYPGVGDIKFIRKVEEDFLTWWDSRFLRNLEGFCHEYWGTRILQNIGKFLYDTRRHMPEDINLQRKLYRSLTLTRRDLWHSQLCFICCECLHKCITHNTHTHKNAAAVRQCWHVYNIDLSCHGNYTVEYVYSIQYCQTAQECVRIFIPSSHAVRNVKA